MSSKIVVLFFGVQFGILIILLGILTPYSGAAAVIKFHSDNDKDEMRGTLGVNITSVANVYFIVGGDVGDMLKTALMGVKAQTICWVVSIVTLFLGEMEKIILMAGPETTK